MESAKSALEALGMDMDEVLGIDEGLRVRPSHRDGRICLCGHGLSRHTLVDGIVSCVPSKMSCPCRNIRAVLDVEDTRPFLRKTQGPGPEHALSRGLAVLAASGKEGHWIIDLECDKCGEHSDRLSPVCVTATGVMVRMPTGYDALLCPTCRMGVE